MDLSSLILILLLLNIFFILSSAHHNNHTTSARRKGQPRFKPGPWKNAHATFYGGPDGSQTLQGACGYEDVVKQGYGLKTAALSQVLFTNGGTCGACYEITCFNDDKWCKKGAPSLLVTATNNCPPNYALSANNGGWCNPPLEHFDLSQPAFLQIAEYSAGIVPVQYRRVHCQKTGGMKFTITGNPYFNTVMVWNVGGAGDVIGVKVKGNKKLRWTSLNRDWGQKWVTNAMLSGQTLSFRVMTSDHRELTSWHVVPQNWQFGQTFEGKNFR